MCVLFAFGLALAASSTAQAGPLYVSLTFDDGLVSQYDQRDLLDGLGVDATYFVNSNKVGLPGNMTWQQLRDMQSAGHEIGGHTLDHADLTRLTTTQQQTQVCDDRRALQAQGFDPVSFAYPFGAQNSGVKTVVRDCGYTSARITGGLDEPPDCCLYANAIPPRNPDPFLTRAFQIRTTTALDIYREVVELGRDNGGGWIPFVFHDICTGTCSGWNNYTVRRDLLEQFVRWLQADSQIRIRTSGHVMAIAGDATAPVATLTSPADGATVSTGNVTLTATATDAVGVDRVEFLVGGSVVGTDATAPYSYDWDASGAGSSARISVRAYDERGNFGTSATHTIAIRAPPETTPPTVALTAPTDGATVGPGTVRLTATASDASGIDRVDFVVDGSVAGSDSSAPYEYSWDSSRAGATARIAARAYDGAGNDATSATATVTVASLERIPPTVSLGYQPSTVTGTLGFTATATDHSGIGRVEFLVDGNVVATDATSPYEATWDSTALIGSSAVLSARAYDTVGNQATSTTRRVSVVAPSSSTRPVVTLVTPAGGTTVRGVVDLVADVSSSPTTVRFVEILVDGQSIGIDWGAAFHEYWNSATAAGSTATVVARAIDVFGVPAESAPMVLTISR